MRRRNFEIFFIKFHVENLNDIHPRIRSSGTERLVPDFLNEIRNKTFAEIRHAFSAH